MKKLEIFSKKLGKNITVKAVENRPVMGWTNSGWSKSGGWKKPV